MQTFSTAFCIYFYTKTSFGARYTLLSALDKNCSEGLKRYSIFTKMWQITTVSQKKTSSCTQIPGVFADTYRKNIKRNISHRCSIIVDRRAFGTRQRMVLTTKWRQVHCVSHQRTALRWYVFVKAVHAVRLKTNVEVRFFSVGERALYLNYRRECLL